MYIGVRIKENRIEILKILSLDGYYYKISDANYNGFKLGNSICGCQKD